MNWYIKGLRSQLDVWSYVHFFGTYTLADVTGRWWLAVGAALLWEGLDVAWAWYVHGSGEFKAVRSNVTGEFYLEPHFLDKVFDRRGFSWVDLALGCLAVGFWVLVNTA
jgi:hypothetical protein